MDAVNRAAERVDEALNKSLLEQAAVIDEKIKALQIELIRGLGLAELIQKGRHLLIRQAADLFLIIAAEDDHRSGENIGYRADSPDADRIGTEILTLRNE